MSAPAFVSADVRAEGLGRRGWLVNFTRAIDAVPGCVAVPADSEAEAIARAVHLACLAGFVSGPAEIGNVEASDAGAPLRFVVDLLVSGLRAHGLSPDDVRIMAVDTPKPEPKPEPAPAAVGGFVVPSWARSRAVHGVILVLAAPALAWAHHETAIAEVAAGLGIWIPVGILAALGLVDRLRFWWRDGARVSVGRDGLAMFYGSRALSGAGWHACGEVNRSVRVLVLDLGSPWFRFEGYVRAFWVRSQGE